MGERRQHQRRRRHWTVKYRIAILTMSLPLVAAAVALWVAFSGPTEDTPAAQLPSVTAQTSNTAQAANAAQGSNDAGTAPESANMFQLRAAVRTAPRNGEARARLGIALMRTGQRVAAERELRQAIDPSASDIRPVDMVVPNLLRVMLQRNEMKELLNQFPEPPEGTQSKVAADILSARAFALQTLHQPVDARAAMDRSLALRRDVDGLVASASLAQQQRNAALARSQTDEVLKLAPTNEAAGVRSIQLARESGDLKQARANADEFVRRAPRSLFARALRIEVLLELNEEEKAKEDVDILLGAAPPYGKFYKAVLAAQDKDIQGAWAQLQTLQPEFIQGQAFRVMTVANMAMAAGRVNSGSAILTTYVARHPDDRLARLELAAARLLQNEPQAALDALDPITVRDPAVDSLLALGYLQSQRFADALASLEAVSSLPKPNNFLQQQLALSQFQVAESDQIIRGFKTLLEDDPDNLTAAAPLIATLIAAGKWDDALKVAEGIAKQAPKSPFPAFYEGQIFVARGNLAKAEAAFDRALAVAPNFVPALYYRANVLVARGEPEAAKKSLEALLSQNPANALASIRLAEIALDAGKDQEAATLLVSTQRRFVTSPLPRLALANYQIGRAKYQDAQATLNQLKEISKNNPEGQALQAKIESLSGRPADASRTLRVLINGNTEQPAAYALAARALYASKEQLAAEAAISKGMDLAPDSAQMRRELIGIQIGGGKGDDAIATARTYRSENPGLEADLLLADTLFRLKRADEAHALGEKILNGTPPSRFVVQWSQAAMNAGNFKEASAVLSNWIAKNPTDLVVQREYAALKKRSGDFLQ
jgi:putative PEP-CTERM system TPR-repeat lipoprotein